jgi:AraC family transcriptional regulator, regulatory protein of adaptative response / methylated-DNA-[protein]-cysteine methyltransferase
LNSLPDTARIPDLEQLAGEVNLTKHHFHRLFKRETGLTPRQYALLTRKPTNSNSNSESASSNVRTPETSTDSSIPTPSFNEDGVLDSYYIDPSLLELGKDLSVQLESFTVYYSIVDTTYGLLMIAFQDQEVCHLEFGVEAQSLVATMEAAFPALYYLHTSVDLADETKAIYLRQRIAAIVESLEDPGRQFQDDTLLDTRW